MASPDSTSSDEMPSSSSFSPKLVTLHELAKQEIRHGLLSGDALANLPNIFEIGLSLSYVRQKKIPTILNSASFVLLPDSYTKDYLDVNRLLRLHDTENSQCKFDSSNNIESSGGSLVWSSDTQLRLLFNSERLHIDGIFSSSPLGFEQIFNIQLIHHGTRKQLL
ncbi:unnamed protein product [Adineta ricciae]|uniref:Uncharacterized protein n=1 Tax=Adineta ricciae TaxID=249248 RepID=A0A815V707_ADIRI|nr:unnamed protein product [Adineta ricciae]